MSVSSWNRDVLDSEEVLATEMPATYIIGN